MPFDGARMIARLATALLLLCGPLLSADAWQGTVLAYAKEPTPTATTPPKQVKIIVTATPAVATTEPSPTPGTSRAGWPAAQGQTATGPSATVTPGESQPTRSAN